MILRKFPHIHLIYPVILLTFCLLNSGCSNDAVAESSDAPMEMKVNVVGFKAQQQDLTDSIFMVGTLAVNEFVEIQSEINGIVEKINFKEGQKVKKGDVLFQVEKNKLQAFFEQAKANLKLAETTAKRYENLVKAKAVSQQEYDEAAATLESSRAALEVAKEELDDATITAPFSGVMGERLISVGQYISQGTKLSFIYDQDPIKVEFNVPERYRSKIKLGQTVEMKVAAYMENTYKGTVRYIAPKIDGLTRTVQVKAYVDNSSGELYGGMLANVNLITNVDKNAITVPETALIIKADDTFVYIVGEDDAVELKEVTPGKRFEGGMVVIEKGLEKDEVVVIEGYQKIGPGSKVNVRFEDPSERKSYEII